MEFSNETLDIDVSCVRPAFEHCPEFPSPGGPGSGLDRQAVLPFFLGSPCNLGADLASYRLGWSRFVWNHWLGL